MSREEIVYSIYVYMYRAGAAIANAAPEKIEKQNMPEVIVRVDIMLGGQRKLPNPYSQNAMPNNARVNIRLVRILSPPNRRRTFNAYALAMMFQSDEYSSQFTPPTCPSSSPCNSCSPRRRRQKQARSCTCAQSY